MQIRGLRWLLVLQFDYLTVLYKSPMLLQQSALTKALCYYKLLTHHLSMLPVFS